MEVGRSCYWIDVARRWPIGPTWTWDPVSWYYLWTRFDLIIFLFWESRPSRRTAKSLERRPPTWLQQPSSLASQFSSDSSLLYRVTSTWSWLFSYGGPRHQRLGRHALRKSKLVWSPPEESLRGQVRIGGPSRGLSGRYENMLLWCATMVHQQLTACIASLQ